MRGRWGGWNGWDGTLRYQGLRVSQVLHLHERDVDPARGVIVARVGNAGAKGAPTRVLPLHAALVEEMPNWERERGYFFTRPDGSRWRGDAVVEPFRRAWSKAGVPVDRWDRPEGIEGLPGERAHGRPSHALRACFINGLIGGGIAQAIVDYLVGHSKGAVTDAYLVQGRVEQSPYWGEVCKAIRAVPRVGGGLAGA